MAFPFNFAQLGRSHQPAFGSWAPGGGRPPFAFGASGGAPASATPPALPASTDAVHGWQAKLPTGSTWTPGQGAPPWANGGGHDGQGLPVAGTPPPAGVASSYSGGGALSTLAGGGAGDLPSYPARQGALASLAGGGAGDMPPPVGIAPTSYSTAPRLPGISPSTMTTAQRTQQLAQVLGGYRGTM